jgi:hypothetical protein
MKKIMKIIVILFASMLMSCSGNSEDENNDPVVGTWKPDYYTERDGERFPYPDCFSNSSFIFKSDGTGITEWYQEDTSGNCATTETLNFEWKYEGVKAYALSIEDDIIYADDDEYTYFIMNDTKTELTHYEDSKYGTSGYSETFKKQ